MAGALSQAITCKLLGVEFCPDTKQEPITISADRELKLIDKTMRGWVEFLYTIKKTELKTLRVKEIELYWGRFSDLTCYFPHTIQFLLRSDPDVKRGEQD